MTSDDGATLDDRGAIIRRFDPPLLPMAEPFWAAIDRGALVLPRCSVCHRWQWYPEATGTDCTGGRLEWEPVALTGTLYSFTIVHRSFLPNGRAAVPYAVGFIDLDGLDERDRLVAGAELDRPDDRPRLVANLAPSPELAVGIRLRATFVRVGDRQHPVFVPEHPG
jgi:uncharacterized protein